MVCCVCVLPDSIGLFNKYVIRKAEIEENAIYMAATEIQKNVRGLLARKKCI